MLKRQVVLVPKVLQIRFNDNNLNLCYYIQDEATGSIMNETHLNFTPSVELLGMLEKEIHNAIKIIKNQESWKEK